MGRGDIMVKSERVKIFLLYLGEMKAVEAMTPLIDFIKVKE